MEFTYIATAANAAYQTLSSDVASKFACAALKVLAARDRSIKSRAAIPIECAILTAGVAPVNFKDFRFFKATAPVQNIIITDAIAVRNVIDLVALALTVIILKAHIASHLQIIAIGIDTAW